MKNNPKAAAQSVFELWCDSVVENRVSHADEVSGLEELIRMLQHRHATLKLLAVTKGKRT